MEARQLWGASRPSPTTSADVSLCTAFELLAGGILQPAGPDPTTLTAGILFQPACTSAADVLLTGAGSPSSTTDFRDPFYASTLPECYALAAATVIAYMLVIMLMITPRTFLHEGAVVLGRRGFTNGPSGANNGIGIGGRPWLQKVAAASVAISLTIATVDTFEVAKSQYDKGFMDASELQKAVEGGLALKVFRVISDTFLWLAQAQTLIRLFPRQREKVIIKWTAFALITLDVVFSILNNFVYPGSNSTRPRLFEDAIPALSYLFQLALSLLYCAWVIYYALTKKRFAFYHKHMKNQCLVALLSLVSVLVPVVFFVVDISKPDVAGWGDYVRWVGAAAASVVVWEWVERIEALERNEKRDGVLGREIFDGDEMLESESTHKLGWVDRFKIFKGDEKDRGDGGDGGGGGTASGVNSIWPSVGGITSRHKSRANQDLESGAGLESPERTRRKRGMRKRVPRPRPPLWPARPAQAVTPVSRTDTASAESTVYAVRYHPLSEATPPMVNTSGIIADARAPSEALNQQMPDSPQSGGLDAEKDIIIQEEDAPEMQQRKGLTSLGRMNPFKRKVQGPPAEVKPHAAKPQDANSIHGSTYRWDVRAKIEDFAVHQADRIRDRSKGGNDNVELPVTVIPAPSRRRHYEQALAELEERDEWEPTARHEPEDRHVGTGTHVASLPPRASDPYRPDDLGGHSVHQRGAISFATATSNGRIPHLEPSIAAPPTNQSDMPATDRDVTMPVVAPDNSRSPTNASSVAISRDSPAELRRTLSPAVSFTGRRDGLAVLSIPAPPRRTRSNANDE